MAIKDYAKKVAGKKKHEIFLFTLSTCAWCMKTKKLLNTLGIEYSYIDVDLLDDDVRDEVMKDFDRWNSDESFPTIVINNKRCITGYHEDKIRELDK